MDARLKAAHSKLTELRERTDLALKPTPLLKPTFTDFDGEEKPLRIRYYQVQGILHLVVMTRFLLGDDTGLGKCVVGDTLVKTDRGLVPIRDLNPGVEEPDSFAPLGDVRVQIGRSKVRARHFYYGGERPTIRLRTRSGYELEGSQIHPVMVRREGVDQWVRLRDLQKGDFVAVERTNDLLTPEPRPEPNLPGPGAGAPNERKHRIPLTMTPDLARFLGYLVGEGWFRRRDFFTLSQYREVNPEVYEDMENLGHALFDVKIQPDDEGFTVASTQVLRFLRGIGCEPKLAPEKGVPWSVLQASPVSMREFLRGFVDSEGSASELGIEVSSSSERLLREIQIMLLSFGVISQRNPKTVGGRDHLYWRLQIQGANARIFAKRIGLISARKIAALQPLLEQESNPNYDVVPLALGEVEDLRAEVYARAGRHGCHGPGIAERWGSAFCNTLGHVRAGRCNPTYQYLERFLEIAREVGVSELNPAYGHVQALVRRRWFYDPVEVVEDGWAEVYDLEVEDPRHAFVSNGILSHNTLMGVAALCYVWAKEPDMKAIVVTNKSLVHQWAGEFNKFCVPGKINVLVCVGTPAKRRKVYREYEASTGPTVLIMGYATARRDIREIQEWSGHALITDEASAYKNPSTQTYQVIRHLGNPERAARHWGLTATLIKNNLIEGFGIYSLLVPGLFPPSKHRFMAEYCLTRLQPIPNSRRQIPVIIGYRSDQIARFRGKIDPYFLSRAKFDVAKELPVLTLREHKVGMTPEQDEKYREALSGLLEIDKTGEEKEMTKLTALTYCQEIVDHPGLVDCDGDSEKMDALFTLLTEGDFVDEKVIVFSRFRKMVDRLEEAANSKKYRLPTVRVTGKEDEEERREAMRRFQDPKDEIRVCWITTAAKEGVNLQAAKVLIFYDSPWSAGDYLQVIGRMIRIGSLHDRCYAIHLVARGTIDAHVMAVLRSKMKLIEQVMGKRLKGEAMKERVVAEQDSIDDLFAAMSNDARRYT